MPFKVYDPKENTIVWFGQIISGFGDGEFVNIEYDEDDYSVHTGSAGETAVARSNIETATMTMTLLSTSDSHAVLSAIRNRNLRSGKPFGVFQVKDKNLNQKAHSEQSLIQKAPAFVKSREVDGWTWTGRLMKLNLDL